MIVRKIQRWDYDDIIDMLKDFARHIQVDYFQKDQYDYAQAKRILQRCEYTGESFVSEDNNSITGMILSMAVPELWFPKEYRLVELAWWVRPEYRMTSAGARLFAKYCEQADLKLKKRQITGYTVSKMSNSPKLDYARRGFRLIEQTYLMGE